jgi:CDP-diacylglycerol--serine O-phosphatidyltransferase
MVLHGCSTFRVRLVQLDSLADMVTSGVVPGLVMFQMMIDHSSTAVVAHMQWFPYLGFDYIGFLLPLSNFNIDRQTDSLGLPRQQMPCLF